MIIFKTSLFNHPQVKPHTTHDPNRSVLKSTSHELQTIIIKQKTMIFSESWHMMTHHWWTTFRLKPCWQNKIHFAKTHYHNIEIISPPQKVPSLNWSYLKLLLRWQPCVRNRKIHQAIYSWRYRSMHWLELLRIQSPTMMTSVTTESNGEQLFVSYRYGVGI